MYSLGMDENIVLPSIYILSRDSFSQFFKESGKAGHFPNFLSSHALCGVYDVFLKMLSAAEVFPEPKDLSRSQQKPHAFVR